ncbi:sushi, von Willebrand factor type A, EGF and pentraxin domain-containing protein 1 [Trichonephila clavipes]|uniref:Sushi, von Willebrand factor type A, EGF and pentraxin domain-containing protein 1 n=1 Tax=Trichonephila clavipes TaxID=2585209 RepID=A0A8X6RHJ9_TRICX|nr:sushi, von Willebrand factor type A, EGF and pentraxin domain-containing protein 1 [Trichonephila clavipes]
MSQSVTVSIFLVFMPPSPTINAFCGVIAKMSAFLAFLCDCGSLVVKVSDRGWLVASSSPVPLKTRRKEEDCGSPVVKVSDHVLCSPGTFYDSSARECWDCPIGHYQEDEGQLECNTCPDGMTTEYFRTRNETECKGICQPGTYSPTGLETCLACPIGTYQEHSRQHTCSVCPEGTTTASLQSASEFDCWEICNVGHFSNTGLQPCDACPKGFYQPFTGQSKCLECPSNFTTEIVGATNVSQCLDLDPCAKKDHCMNDGVCTRHGREAKCICKEGFGGDRCEHDIDECLQKPCFNDGICVNVGFSSDIHRGNLLTPSTALKHDLQCLKIHIIHKHNRAHLASQNNPHYSLDKIRQTGCNWHSYL